MSAGLLIATGNAHKLDEYRALLPGVAFMGQGAFPPGPVAAEDAATFEGNAVQKARLAAAHTGLVALADDSGLEVAALDGAPGVRSARWVPGSDADRVRALLARLETVADRRARFVCAVAVAGLSASTLAALEGRGTLIMEGCAVVRGEVEGWLAYAPRGEGGFGYDPIFLLPEGRSMAELSAAEKNAISHRGEAARAALPLLLSIFS